MGAYMGKPSCITPQPSRHIVLSTSYLSMCKRLIVNQSVNKCRLCLKYSQIKWKQKYIQSQATTSECVMVCLSSYFLTKIYVVGAQNNRLNETVLLSTQNTCLN